VNYEFETGAEILEIIDRCSDRKKLVDILLFIHKRLESDVMPIEGYMWQSLCNHVAAMVDRSISGEELEGFDEGLFSEISAESIQLADDITIRIGNLASIEKYLLSVHFERAKRQL